MKNWILALFMLSIGTLVACRGGGEIAKGPVYTVEGAVAIAGRFPWKTDLTILDAVNNARPLEGSCNLGRVELRRAGSAQSMTLTIDVQHMIDTGDTSANVLVYTGDKIRVPAKGGR